MGSDTVTVACGPGKRTDACYNIDASNTVQACRNPAECYADIPKFGDFYKCEPSKDMDWHKARKTTHYLNLDGPRYFKYEGIEVVEEASISSVNRSVSIPLRVALDGTEGITGGISANGESAGVLGLAKAAFTCRNDSTIADFCKTDGDLQGVTLDLPNSRLLFWNGDLPSGQGIWSEGLQDSGPRLPRYPGFMVYHPTMCGSGMLTPDISSSWLAVASTLHECLIVPSVFLESLLGWASSLHCSSSNRTCIADGPLPTLSFRLDEDRTSPTFSLPLEALLMEDKKTLCLQSFSSQLTGEFTNTPIIFGIRALRAAFSNITWAGNRVGFEVVKPSNEATASAGFGCALKPACIGQQRYDSRTNACIDPVCSAYALMTVDGLSKTCVWSTWVPYVFAMVVVLLSIGDVLSQRLYRISVRLAAQKVEPRSLRNSDVVVIEQEICFNVQVTGTVLTVEEENRLLWLLQETFPCLGSVATKETSLTEAKDGSTEVVEVGPRQQFVTAWCTNAVSICLSAGISSIERIERTRRYLIKRPSSTEQRATFLSQIHDRMTEMEYPVASGGFLYAEAAKPAPWGEVDVMGEGQKALESFSESNGLGYDSQDIDYYVKLFRDDLKRNPTTVECFDLAQGNSEHSRHWFFGGKLVVDGEEVPHTLFQLVKSPYKRVQQREKEGGRPNASTVAFSDNSSAIRGAAGGFTGLLPDMSTGDFAESSLIYDITFTCETHNFPCGVAPFPGAETGTGGRLRDGQSTGRGSLVVAGTAAYCVGALYLEDEEHEVDWEDRSWRYPSNLAAPVDILIQASNGASDYGNKFGEPVVNGFCRSYGAVVGGERIEWVKPIMMSGGLGAMDCRHRLKQTPPMPGAAIVKLGGPAYRLGVGGGAASSMVAGENQEELDFNAVQRGDPQMLQRVNRVIRYLVEMGEANPVLSIHDQGAGGAGNVLKEIGEPTGLEIDMKHMLIGDPSMSALELWIAEYQENDALLLPESKLGLLGDLCRREGAPWSKVGSVVKTGRCRVVDRDGKVPVDLPLDKVLCKMPQKTFHLTKPKSVDHKLGHFEEDVKTALWKVMRLVSVGSKRFLCNKVDRSVTGLIAQQQCVGPFHTPLANVAVTATSMLSIQGSATAIGERPIIGLSGDDSSLRAMARLAVAEALTNLVWVKLENLEDVRCSGNWMWAAKLPGEGYKMLKVAEAIDEVMSDIGIAIDGGKDSLSMAAQCPRRDDGPEDNKETVKAPGEVVVSVYGAVPDVTVKVTPDVKLSPSESGTSLAHVMLQSGHLNADGRISDFHVDQLRHAFLVTQDLISRGVISAGHDRSDGGLLVAACEMIMSGGHNGYLISIDEGNLREDEGGSGNVMEYLFSEGPGLILEVATSNVPTVMAAYGEKTKCKVLGNGVSGSTNVEVELRMKGGARRQLMVESVKDIRLQWEKTSFKLEELQADVTCVRQERDVMASRTTTPPYRLTFAPLPRAPASTQRKVRVAIIREEGSNGDREMAASFWNAGALPVDVIMGDIATGRTTLQGFAGVAFVGGFSYGDVLDSAKGWAGKATFNTRCRDQLQRFYDEEHTFSLGVCNGCQLMSLLGWVPGKTDKGGMLDLAQRARFVHNRSGRYESRFVSVALDPASPAIGTWFRGMGGSVLGVWIAHGEGRALFPDRDVYTKVMDSHLAPLRYVDDQGAPTSVYPFNPNGSIDGIAGLVTPDGRHLAMMPHPERCSMTWQWPWMPREWKGIRGSPWATMFRNIVEWSESRMAPEFGGGGGMTGRMTATMVSVAEDMDLDVEQLKAL
ncbi:hypothetical protein FOL47_005095 [Perkinsus chesapeaki]|uniref:phosphoribosylformylglycinamidine synthase n=1 Tax=Perkinsus chesapeaki TaxID=330153 RepID=A0A7J6LZ19_PERCH|nr:hypothetical protein FOL47_005095 [Perkinsus chesapeaki]